MEKWCSIWLCQFSMCCSLIIKMELESCSVVYFIFRCFIFYILFWIIIVGIWLLIFWPLSFLQCLISLLILPHLCHTFRVNATSLLQISMPAVFLGRMRWPTSVLRRPLMAWYVHEFAIEFVEECQGIYCAYSFIVQSRQHVLFIFRHMAKYLLGHRPYPYSKQDTRNCS